MNPRLTKLQMIDEVRGRVGKKPLFSAAALRRASLEDAAEEEAHASPPVASITTPRGAMDDRDNRLREERRRKQEEEQRVRDNRQRDLERVAAEKQDHDLCVRENRLNGGAKITGAIVLQLLITSIAFMAHKYLMIAGIICPTVLTAIAASPMSYAVFSLGRSVVTWQANALSTWLWPSCSPRHRARRKSNRSFIHLLVDESPL